MSLFDSLFTNTNARDAAQSQTEGLNSAYHAYEDNANTGRNLLTTNYAAGLQPFQQNYALGSAGATAYGNATGVNGQPGYDAAVDSFHTAPGYQFALDQGSQNVLRNKAATGQLNSGGTNVDLQKLGVGQADQQWQQYVSNLLPFLGQANTAASGIGTLDANLGNTLNTSYQQQGQQAYNTKAGIGNANANADLANNQAAQNSMAAIMQGIKLATSLAGFLPTGGGGMPGGSDSLGFASPAQRA